MKNAIRGMDLNLLRTLDALLDERSVTRAAERLALTQPAVSAMLTRLRDGFGDPLFTRTQRGLVPTLRAQELAAPVKQILQDVDTLLQPKAFDPASATMTLTIAATDYALRAVIVPFIGALRSLAPNIRVSVVGVNNGTLSEQLERGEVDFALLTPETTPPALHSRKLYDETYVCVMRNDHPAAAVPALSLDEFCAWDQVLVSYSGKRFSGVTDAALNKIGRQRRVVMTVSSFLMVPEILQVSDLIAVVPRRLADDSATLTVRTPPVSVEGFSKTLAWHERTHRDPAHRWLRALLGGIFA